MKNAGNGTVLVTGGASGIGAAIAGAFLEAGYAVHVSDVSSEAITRFRHDHPDVSASLAAVEDEGQMRKLFNELESLHGGLRVLVNNAGIAGPTAAIEDMNLEAWKSTLAVNLDGAMLATRNAVPLISAEQGGCIINISSTGGLFGYPNRSPYAAAKWGLIGLTKTWAMELGQRGIRVNAICPGSVEGPRIEGVIARDAQERGVEARVVREAYQRQTSMRCFVAAEEIADLAVFLASDRARHISGQVIAVDGHTEGLGNGFG